MDSSLRFILCLRVAAARHSSPQLATARLSIARFAARVYVRSAISRPDANCALLGVLARGRVCWLVCCWVVAKKWVISVLQLYLSFISSVYLSSKGCAAKTSSVLFIITMHKLRATADVGGGIGRSSGMDRSKALDLFSPELHWSSFLDFVRKYRHRNKMARHF